MKYDLVIVTSVPFPNGQAPANRILSYAKGIAKEKSVLLLTFAGPGYGDKSNTVNKGTFNGVDFKYMGKAYMENRPNKVIRALMFLYRMLMLYVSVLFLYNYKSILVYSRNTGLIKKLRFITNLKHSSLYCDITEAAGQRKTPESALERKKSCECLQGTIAISKPIFDTFLDNIDNTKKIYLPVLVDMDRFPIPIQSVKEKYIFCCSGANLERDGFLDCLNGFLLFNKNNPGYIFKIASAINESDSYHKRCKEIIDNNPNVIEYLGVLPSKDIPSFMINATALMLTPHNEYQTQGFPTKLGEYLASGTPVICSKIRDLEIVDTDCCLMVSPNSPKEISEKLEYIINNPIKAREIGLKGRQWVEQNFTYDKYKSALINFLKI